METALGEATKLLGNIMVNYSQWHTERSTSKKVHAIEEISVLSGKLDELMKLLSAKSGSSDPNDMPLSTLIENSNESLDVNFLVGIILVTMLIEVILILGLFLVIPLIILVIPTTTLMERRLLNLKLVLRSLRIRKRISVLCLKKNCLRLMNWLEVWIELLLMLIL